MFITRITFEFAFFILIVVICGCCFEAVIHKCFLFLLEVILVLYPEYKLECILKHTDRSLGLLSFNAEMCCCFCIPSSVRGFLCFLNTSFCFCEV